MTPTERILLALEEQSCQPKRNGNGWYARCPAHDDRRPSLSVTEGDDGRALVRCHAGCSVEAICNAAGLRLAEIMPDAHSNASTSTQLPKSRSRPQYRRQNNGKPSTYAAADAAIAVLERQHGKRSCSWTYRDSQGDPVGVIVRWDKREGKVIRPVSRKGDGWSVGGMSAPRPLYCLPELAHADRVFIAEGEKAAEAACSIGLTATTSAHGSESADKADWSPLAGKECVILPDNDEAGNKYAEEQTDLSGELSAAWSKLEEYAARLALVIHYARWAANDPHLEHDDVVDAQSMKAGIALAEWFKAEARRVYALLSESDEDREQRRLIEWIERKGGSVTARQVQQGHRQYRTSQEAETALQELVKAGCGQWQTTAPEQRGQPTRHFVLSTPSTVYGNHTNSEEKSNTVDVDDSDGLETEADDEWGEL